MTKSRLAIELALDDECDVCGFPLELLGHSMECPIRPPTDEDLEAMFKEYEERRMR